VAEDVFDDLLSEVRCNGVTKLIHRHDVLIDLEGQIYTAEAERGRDRKGRGRERGKRKEGRGV
jgi:hypothetical protein